MRKQGTNGNSFSISLSQLAASEEEESPRNPMRQQEGMLKRSRCRPNLSFGADFCIRPVRRANDPEVSLIDQNLSNVKARELFLAKIVELTPLDLCLFAKHVKFCLSKGLVSYSLS